jgi:hypothetical protein
MRSIAKILGLFCVIAALSVVMVTFRHGLEVQRASRKSPPPLDQSIDVFGRDAEIIYSCKQDSDCIAVSSNCDPCLDMDAINAAQRDHYEDVAIKQCAKEAASCSSPMQGEKGPHPVCTQGICRLSVPLPEKYRTCIMDSDCVAVSTNCIRCGNDEGINAKWVNEYLIMVVHANEMCGRPTGAIACPGPVGGPTAACVNAKCEYQR